MQQNTIVWPRVPKQLSTTAPSSNLNVIWQYFVLMRLCLAMLFIISITVKSNFDKHYFWCWQFFKMHLICPTVKLTNLRIFRFYRVFRIFRIQIKWVIVHYTKTVTYDDGPKMKREAWVKVIFFLSKKTTFTQVSFPFWPIVVRYRFNSSLQDLYKIILNRSRTQQARTGALFNDKDAWSRINFANQQEWKKLAAASFKRELLLCFCFGTSKMNVLKVCKDLLSKIVLIYCDKDFYMCKIIFCTVL